MRTSLVVNAAMMYEYDRSDRAVCHTVYSPFRRIGVRTTVVHVVMEVLRDGDRREGG